MRFLAENEEAVKRPLAGRIHNNPGSKSQQANKLTTRFGVSYLVDGRAW